MISAWCCIALVNHEIFLVPSGSSGCRRSEPVHDEAAASEWEDLSLPDGPSRVSPLQEAQPADDEPADAGDEQPGDAAAVGEQRHDTGDGAVFDGWGVPADAAGNPATSTWEGAQADRVAGVALGLT